MLWILWLFTYMYISLVYFSNLFLENIFSYYSLLCYYYVIFFK